MAIDVKHYLRMKSEGDRKANRMYLEGLVWAHLDRELIRANRKKETDAFNYRFGVGSDQLENLASARVAASPLDSPLAVDEPCPFHSGLNGRKGPCHFGDKCSRSHVKAVCDAYLKANPQAKRTARDGKPDAKAKGKASGKGRARGRTPGRDSRRRGRGGSRDSSQRRSTSAGSVSRSGSNRHSSIPPSNGCGTYILHKINGGPACAQERCRYDHPKQTSEEDKAWAKKKKQHRPRADSSPLPPRGRGAVHGTETKTKSKKKDKDKS